MSNKKVKVLMSTYNGEKYLAQQLDSLLAQTYSDIEVLIRDDGSTDSTKEILTKYCSENSNIEYYEGDNLGVVGSFFELLYSVDETIDFIAFCDQDDFWHAEKVEVAVRKISCAKPTMYCSATNLVDSNLSFITVSRSLNKSLGLGNSLVENIATGCTIVINRQGIDLLLSSNLNINKIIMHDFWFYLVFSSVGHIVYDRNSYIDYRQHESNVVGSSSGLKLFLSRVNRLSLGSNMQIFEQAAELYRLYGDQLSGDKKKLISNFIASINSNSLIERSYRVFNLPVYRQNKFDTFVFKALFVLGHYRSDRGL